GSKGGCTCWTGMPSGAGNTVLSTSWRRTTRARARASARPSGAVGVRSTMGMLYAQLPGTSRSRIHSRRWAKETGPVRVSSSRPRSASSLASRRRLSSRASVDIWSVTGLPVFLVAVGPMGGALWSSAVMRGEARGPADGGVGAAGPRAVGGAGRRGRVLGGLQFRRDLVLDAVHRAGHQPADGGPGEHRGQGERRGVPPHGGRGGAEDGAERVGAPDQRE